MTAKKEHDCKEVKRVMTDHMSGRPPDGGLPEAEAAAFIQTHTTACPRCRREYRVLQAIHGAAQGVEKNADLFMQNIDWDANAVNVSRTARVKSSRVQRLVPLQVRQWKFAAPVMAALLFVGVMVGYLLFHSSPTGPKALGPGDGTPSASGATLARLETTLARKELRRFFQQTQLMLTELMRPCGEASAPVPAVSHAQVRVLLNKSRYFEQDLGNPRLASARPLMRKIEWVLYELSSTNDNLSCQQVRRLQQYIKKEQLLLKLHLVGKDIEYNEV